MQLQLGIDNYSLRAFGWNAAQLIDYAASLRLDVLMLSDLAVFGSRAASHLRDLRSRAADHGLALQVGMLSICPSSVMFDPRRGTAGEQLREAIRVAVSDPGRWPRSHAAPGAGADCAALCARAAATSLR